MKYFPLMLVTTDDGEGCAPNCMALNTPFGQCAFYGGLLFKGEHFDRAERCKKHFKVTDPPPRFQRDPS